MGGDRQLRSDPLPSIKREERTTEISSRGHTKRERKNYEFQGRANFVFLQKEGIGWGCKKEKKIGLNEGREELLFVRVPKGTLEPQPRRKGRMNSDKISRAGQETKKEEDGRRKLV